MAASTTFWLFLALSAVSFCDRSMASRVLQQVPTPPSKAGTTPGQCTGVTFPANALRSVAANCTGTQPSQVTCCGAINNLWENAGIASNQAAQTLGNATVNRNTERACLDLTLRDLAPFGVIANLSKGCADPLIFEITPNNTCPIKVLPTAAAQAALSACANLLTANINFVCGACFNAFTDVTAGLLGVSRSGALSAIAAGNTTAQNCATVTIVRLLQLNPGEFYRVGAFLDKAFNGAGCAAGLGLKYSTHMLLLKYPGTEGDSEVQADAGQVVKKGKRKRVILEESTVAQSVHVNAAILATKSEVLDRLLNSEMQGESAVPSVVLQSEEEAGLMITLLKFCYSSGAVEEVAASKERLLGLLMLADKFGVTECIQACASILGKSVSTVADAGLYLSLPAHLREQPALRSYVELSSKALMKLL
ncbi:hypothetical protein KFL_000240350 [Klebsormidium nitens]|uniref:BTB domain-containing protein n=1 Tax=Klebsormidium nitens TaxID=105231 RepID=A0A1Y1HKI4_KLENI|nr:hypothetical protein KFL_000240350 [Klebsormidium nitens]|eukprot:GAQ79104.1 hypothetical protein KFL_000240350 [Klebsormidium nitens]